MLADIAGSVDKLPAANCALSIAATVIMSVVATAPVDAPKKSSTNTSPSGPDPLAKVSR
jgi:hypothetical protein